MRDVLDDRDEFASAYASGRAPAALRLLLETHSALNPHQVDDLAVADAFAGTRLETEAPAALNDDALERAFAAIDASSVGSTAHADAARSAGRSLQELLDLPEPVRDVALDALERDGWAFAGPGVRRLSLIDDGETKAELYRIEAGTKVALHSHKGREITLVLRGAFHDRGRLVTRGQVSVADDSVEHRPQATKDMDCFALAVTDAPLQLSGLLGVAQRLFGAH